MSLFSRLSEVSRQGKLAVFREVLRPSASVRILDIGGETAEATSSGAVLLDVYKWKERIVVLNLSFEQVRLIRDRYPGVAVVVGNATALPFANRSFDVAFSSAVIEHVGPWSKQKEMAREMMRVSHCWFLATPNRWFPFEFHARLPLVSWLPAKWMAAICRFICYNHVHKRYQSGINLDGLRLLTSRELRKLFPGSTVVGHRVTVYPETLLVHGRHEQLARQATSSAGRNRQD